MFLCLLCMVSLWFCLFACFASIIGFGCVLFVACVAVCIACCVPCFVFVGVVVLRCFLNTLCVCLCVVLSVRFCVPLGHYYVLSVPVYLLVM